MRSKYLMYRDCFISVFHDDEKYLIIMVNDRGQTQVLDYDSNFYSVEDNIIAYDKLIKHAWTDKDEQKKYLGKFIKYVEKELKNSNEELNYEYLGFHGISVEKARK